VRLQIQTPGHYDGRGVRYRLFSPLAPGHFMEFETATSTVDGQSVQIDVLLSIDGDRIPIFTKHFDQDQLADAYEKAHHEHHGYDPRGLDPRVEKTRLTVNRE